jgi:hypothetical protein
MKKNNQLEKHRERDVISVRITKKDIAAGGTKRQIIRRALARTYGNPVPRWAVQAGLAAVQAAGMPARVKHVMAQMKKAGHIVKCNDGDGRHWHIGTADTGFVQYEGFDVETVMEGEPPILLPHGDGLTSSFTTAGVKQWIKVMLEEKDKAAR